MMGAGLKFTKLASIALMAGAIAACSSGPRSIPRERIDRALQGAPGEAQPSKIVATDIAYNRAAQEEGQYSAAKRFAASGAVIHGRSGPVDAITLLNTLDDPAEPLQWEPRSVWMSCDGQMAVGQGRFTKPDGIVGTYVTVWERQADGAYLYVYDIAAPDNPQPAPRSPEPALQPGDIVVEALDSVQADIADCLKGDEALPDVPAMAVRANIRTGFRWSRDRTLRWRWSHGENGVRSVSLDMLKGEEYQSVFTQDLSLPPE